MPVRIYDISKKLGLESKVVLAFAKELGIAAAKVPSSSLDRISGEWLEEHIIANNPDLAARLKPKGFNNTPAPIPPPQQVNAPSQGIGLHTITEEQSLAIRLKSDASVEIYNFNDARFQHLGNFAFEIEPRTNQDKTIPEEIVLLTNNESATLEFKPSARWDFYQNRLNPDLQKGICKSVAAFLNTEGGTLLIGVADNAKVLGLKKDFETLQKPKSDDYLLFLHNVLFDNLGNDLGSCIKITVDRLGDKEVCQVAVRRSPRPVYVKDGQNDLFYIRVGNSSRNLPLKSTVEYCKARWTGNSPVWT
jgi:hypothetical protein